MKHRTATIKGDLLDAAVALADGRLLVGDEPGWPKGDYRKLRAEYGGAHVVRWYAREGENADGPETKEVGGWEPIDNWGSPSTDWSMGGPIIERERITVGWDEYAARFVAELEHAARPDGVQRSSAQGHTNLIAAMRAYVASKFGGEVEIP
jgi:hypothetical protein